MEDSMIAIFRNALARFRGQILGWGLSLGLMAALLTRFYDTIADQKDNYIKLMSNYPKEFMAFFSTSDVMQMFTPSGFLNIEYFSYMTLIVGIFAILAGSGLLAGDEESGALDLVLAHPVSRTALFAGRCLAFLAATVAILAINWLGFILAAPGTQLHLTAGELALPLLSQFGLLAIFGALALLLSLLLPSQRLAAMTSGILLVACYFINAMANINKDLEPLAKFSPFHYYQGGLAIDGMKWDVLAAMVGVSLLLVILAWWRFERRDIRVGGEGGWFIPMLSPRKRDATAGE
jgi:ABC-2 type transport system permease protein